jgi:hypothetical protein
LKVVVKIGSHPELVTLKAEIEEKKGKRISSAEAWRKHQHANFKHQFEEFEYEANIHFIVSLDDMFNMMETLISLLFSRHKKRH